MAEDIFDAHTAALQLKQTLESSRRSGVRHSPRIARKNAPTSHGKTTADAPVLEVLNNLAVEVSSCEKCQLSQSRTKTVFGVGDMNADLVFIGEAPGADEDRQGEPFVGAAGKLITKIIQAMGLSREQVYICNILKCRPPGNRNPAPDEIESCIGYLEQQLSLISPKYICTLGAIASNTLLQRKGSLGSLRGRFHDYRGIKLLCTYHPAYLLRNPAAKGDTWADIQILMREMGLPIATRSES